MSRVNESKTLIGQMAFTYYSTWMKLYKRNTPRHEAFLISKYYNAFIKFAQYIKDMQLVDVDLFIKLMVEKDFSPHLWTNDKVYVLYIEHLDRRTTPYKQANITITTLINIADDNNIDVSNVFSVLKINEILQHIRERRLSPWILLASGKFKKYLMEQTSPEERQLFEQLIRPVYWKQKFEKNPEAVQYMKVYVKELGI